MPIIITLRCNCGKEIVRNKTAEVLKWLVESQAGGTLVLCPECRKIKDGNEFVEQKRKLEIDIKVQQFREELEQKITLNKVEKEMEEIEKILEKELLTVEPNA